MSHDWDPHFASIGETVKPDWAAAATHIDNMTLEQFAELVQMEGVPDVDDATAELLPTAQNVLRSDLAEFKKAVENGHDQIVRFWSSTRKIFIYVIDDQGYSDLWSSIPRLRWSGVISAAGFDDN